MLMTAKVIQIFGSRGIVQPINKATMCSYKKKYKESLKPKTVRVRTKQRTTRYGKRKRRSLKKFGYDPNSNGLDEDITKDEHIKMNDNFLRTGPYKPKKK